EQVAVLFGFRLYDLEDEFFLAEAVIARQIQLPGDLVQLLQRFAFKLGHFQAASPLHISWPRERDCETDDTDADAGHQLPCFWASRQSRRKRSNPLSVSGCWIMRCNTPKGMVATWAPAKAAWVTWSGWRMLAASTCVSILCKSKICTHWATTSMPSWLMSSRRPTKGLTKAAPARAANRAWLAEKIKVTLTSTPWAARAAVASRPARVADAGRQHLRIYIMQIEDLYTLGHHFHAVVVDVVQAAHERTDQSGAGPGGQQGLVGGENQGYVDVHPLGGQGCGGLQACGGGGHLDDHVVGDFSQNPAFLHHLPGAGAGHLGADGPVHQPGDGGDALVEIGPLPGDEGGVGGDPGQDAP